MTNDFVQEASSPDFSSAPFTKSGRSGRTGWLAEITSLQALLAGKADFKSIYLRLMRCHRVRGRFDGTLGNHCRASAQPLINIFTLRIVLVPRQYC